MIPDVDLLITWVLLAPIVVAFWRGVIHWSRWLDRRDQAEQAPIPCRTAIAEWWADVDAWRMRYRAEARR